MLPKIKGGIKATQPKVVDSEKPSAPMGPLGKYTKLTVSHKEPFKKLKIERTGASPKPRVDKPQVTLESHRGISKSRYFILEKGAPFFPKTTSSGSQLKYKQATQSQPLPTKEFKNPRSGGSSFGYPSIHDVVLPKFGSSSPTIGSDLPKQYSGMKKPFSSGSNIGGEIKETTHPLPKVSQQTQKQALTPTTPKDWGQILSVSAKEQGKQQKPLLTQKQQKEIVVPNPTRVPMTKEQQPTTKTKKTETVVSPSVSTKPTSQQLVPTQQPQAGQPPTSTKENQPSGNKPEKENLLLPKKPKLYTKDTPKKQLSYADLATLAAVGYNVGSSFANTMPITGIGTAAQRVPVTMLYQMRPNQFQPSSPYHEMSDKISTTKEGGNKERELSARLKGHIKTLQKLTKESEKGAKKSTKVEKSYNLVIKGKYPRELKKETEKRLDSEMNENSVSESSNMERDVEDTPKTKNRVKLKSITKLTLSKSSVWNS